MRVAQVGLGRIGFLLESDPLRYKPCTHLGTLLTLEKSFQKKGEPIEMVGLCDTDTARLKMVQKKLKGRKGVTFAHDHQEILNLCPDFLVIASSTPSHFEILEEAFKKRISKILIEKPIVARDRELKKVKKLYKDHSSQIWVNYERRYYEKYMKLKKSILEGYGRLISYRGLMLYPSPSFYPSGQYEGGLLHDTTHLLDLLIFFFGIPDRHQKTSPKKSEAVHHILLEHDAFSLQGEIVSIRHPRVFHFELEVITEKARIVVGNGYHQIEKIRTSTEYSRFHSFEIEGKRNLRKDPKPSLKKNPFVKLYQEILSKDSAPDNFHESCANIEILLD